MNFGGQGQYIGRIGVIAAGLPAWLCPIDTRPAHVIAIETLLVKERGPIDSCFSRAIVCAIVFY
jgi:hypothetical protein